MLPEHRADVVKAMVWGYDDDRLSLGELVELVTGEHGSDLAQRFVETLGQGMQSPGGGPIASFARVCIRFGRMDVLEQLVTTSKPVVAGAVILTRSAWLDRLCTRTTATGAVITFSPYQTGLELSPREARAVFAFALKHQPEHPHLAEAMAAGTANSAILTELVMARHISRPTDSANARSAKPASESQESRHSSDSGIHSGRRRLRQV
jgi:hypothetical protein